MLQSFHHNGEKHCSENSPTLFQSRGKEASEILIGDAHYLALDIIQRLKGSLALDAGGKEC